MLRLSAQHPLSAFILCYISSRTPEYHLNINHHSFLNTNYHSSLNTNYHELSMNYFLKIKLMMINVRLMVINVKKKIHG